MRKSWLFIPLSLAALATCRADSVTLVTGEKISGTIKEQTDSEVTIEVPISASITDERTIRKEDIAKIDKEQPDEIEYKSLMLLRPNPQISYAPDTYQQILASLQNFAAKYPNSAHLADIKEQIAAFQDEKEKVDSGEIKYLGQWLTKDQAARRRIQIVAMQVFGAMQQQATGGDYLGAMQTFDTIEKGYATTRSYPPAVTLALQVLARLQQDLAARAQAIVADQAQLKQTILATPEPAKSNLIAAARMEQEHNDAVIAAAVRGGAKWVPLIPRSETSITTLQKTVASEIARLQGVPVATMTRSIAAVDAGRQALSSGDLKTASEDLNQAAQLWNQNEAAHYWTDRLKEKMATPTPTPTPKPTPRPATPKPTVAALKSPAPVVAELPPPPPAQPSFFATPLGMTSSILVVLVAVAGGALALQKKRSAQQE